VNSSFSVITEEKKITNNTEPEEWARKNRLSSSCGDFFLPPPPPAAAATTVGRNLVVGQKSVLHSSWWPELSHGSRAENFAGGNISTTIIFFFFGFEVVSDETTIEYCVVLHD